MKRGFKNRKNNRESSLQIKCSKISKLARSRNFSTTEHLVGKQSLKNKKAIKKMFSIHMLSPAEIKKINPDPGDEFLRKLTTFRTNKKEAYLLITNRGIEDSNLTILKHWSENLTLQLTRASIITPFGFKWSPTEDDTAIRHSQSFQMRANFDKETISFRKMSPHACIFRKFGTKLIYINKRIEFKVDTYIFIVTECNDTKNIIIKIMNSNHKYLKERYVRTVEHTELNIEDFKNYKDSIEKKAKREAEHNLEESDFTETINSDGNETIRSSRPQVNLRRMRDHIEIRIKQDFGNRVLFGRDENNEVIISRRNISSSHFCIGFDYNGSFIKDLNSKNGTWEIVEKEFVLNKKEIFKFDTVNLYFESYEKEEDE